MTLDLLLACPGATIIGDLFLDVSVITDCDLDAVVFVDVDVGGTIDTDIEADAAVAADAKVGVGADVDANDHNADGDTVLDELDAIDWSIIEESFIRLKLYENKL